MMYYGASTATSGSAKEPPVAAAEKFLACYSSGDVEQLTTMLDPAIVMTTPMGLFHGRPHVKGWLSFDSGVIKRHKATLVVHGSQLISDGAKSASVQWSVGSLIFTDVVALNQVLLIRSVRRTWERRKPKSPEEKALTEALLLGWTGPHFEQYCTPKARGVDNRAMVLPVLDFSFCNITRARELLVTKPREGKALDDKDVVLHYMRAAESAQAKKAETNKSSTNNNAATDFGVKDEITIRAKNREGETNAIVIDRKSLGTSGLAAKHSIEALEDSEVAVSEDRARYAASALRVCNNRLEDPRELDQVIRLMMFNAFYFLTWVDLSTNAVAHVPDLTQYPITVLYLHDNKIADWEEVEKLSKLPTLQTLTLYGNGVQAKAPSSRDYKFRALAAVRGPRRKATEMALRNFDHCVLSADDRANVDRYALSVRTGSRPPSRAK